MATTLTQLVNNMQTCATNAGFSTFKFGKPDHINFDHNIKYDLLNLEYPSSRIYDVNSGVQVYNCRITAARPTSIADLTGVQHLDNVHVIMTALENRIWSFLACVGAGNNCQDIIPKETIAINRDKGTHNDNLVTLECTFSVEVFSNCFEVDCNPTAGWPGTPVPKTYNCIKGQCVDPGDGTGFFTGDYAFKDCTLSGCGRKTVSGGSSSSTGLDEGFGLDKEKIEEIKKEEKKDDRKIDEEKKYY
tara:strand:+ start:1471 stop:2208 length:738 start_codon:yes stop_codon:yes gene_type:complete